MPIGRTRASTIPLGDPQALWHAAGAPMPSPLARPTAFVMDVSYFSGKLEAYLRYQGIAYDRVEVGWRRLGTEIRRTTGEAWSPRCGWPMERG
jgi:hypothetical protein